MLVLVAGCVEQVQIQKPEPLRLFNREYYAVKNLTRADIRKMKMLMESEDTSAAKTAGIILGRHYVREGEVEQGYALLKENMDDSYLDRFLKISGHLWLFDAAVKAGDKDTAEAQREYLRGVEIDATAEKAFRHYCAQEKKAALDGSSIKDCALSETPAGESEVEIEIFEEPKKVHEYEMPEKLMEKVVVKVISAESDPQLIEAMLYSISKLGVDVELDFSGERTDYDFTLDAETKIVTSKTNMYEFAIEMDVIFEETVNVAMLNGGLVLVLGYTPELFSKALEIEEKYSETDIKIYKFDITDPNFQATLRTVKEQEGENATISFAVAGTEKQLVKVVPFLRFFSDKPDKTIIACGVDGFGKLFFNNEYAEYFRGAYVVTDVLLLGNSHVEEFNEKYFEDYSKLPGVKDMLGHDLIVFMENLKNPSYMMDFLTGIKSLEEGRPDRDTEAYKIVSTKKIRKLIN